MKKTTIFVLSFVLLVAASLAIAFYSQVNRTVAEIKLLEVAKSTGATIISREAYFWAKGDNDLQTPESHEKLVTELSGVLQLRNTYEDTDMDGNVNFDTICNDNLWEIQANGIIPGGDVINIFGRLIYQKDGENESHLVINISGVPNKGKAGIIESKINEVCKKYGLKPDANYCVTGYFDGKFNNEQLNDVCNSAFRAAGAKEVDGIKDNNLISLTAYSPEFENHIRVDGTRVNLNIAIRYNSYEKRTYIWLATPLITIEY